MYYIGKDVSLYMLHFYYSTGLPTKDATSTTTVELFSVHIITKYALCSHSVTLSELAILFINVYEVITKGKDRLHFQNCAIQGVLGRR